jgi:hypothetical protein
MKRAWRWSRPWRTSEKGEAREEPVAAAFVVLGGRSAIVPVAAVLRRYAGRCGAL